MNKETYKALKDIIEYIEPGEHEYWEECGKPKKGLMYHDIKKVKDWIDEVANG